MNDALQHVAIIMDGNRRWARSRGLPGLKGHEYVVEERLEELCDACIEQGIAYVTMWAFSTENWSRDDAEIEGLMALFRRVCEEEFEALHNKGVQIRTIGNLDAFPPDITQSVTAWVEKTKKNSAITVIFALNYGGRDELVRAFEKSNAQDLSPSEASIAQSLDTAGIPDPELIIRPGGQQRLSGFLPWQSVYSELYFTDVLMPDFDRYELKKALAEYSRRKRTFGG
ncbi:MAG: di-trans,poly-cis-decaprenylcistransferase [Pseudomonadales bacterium]|nr:di-trans,poly-cis-decaprenylcistransferase [Candidatus Woesebacteria bacterium]MCB9801952.1 di-trans,poly-cis-decaprenylcistransferase [Pseudomonadales bacterium]